MIAHFLNAPSVLSIQLIDRAGEDDFKHDCGWPQNAIIALFVQIIAA